MHYGSFILGLLCAGALTATAGGVSHYYVNSESRVFIWTKNFLFGTDTDTRRYTDPLMDVIAENPSGTIIFIKHIMILAILAGCVSSLSCLWYMQKHWHALVAADRPLFSWIIADSLITLVQLPLRVAFVSRLCYLRWAANNDVLMITTGFHKLTSSRAWCLTKSVSLVNYGWFLLGVYWTFTSQPCALQRVCLMIISLTLIRIFITVGSFYYHFPSGGVRNGVRILDDFLSPRGGLSLESLKLLPKPVLAGHLSKTDETCSICISEFEDNFLVRVLSCQHFFHHQCIDQWLLTSNTCPLCQRIALAPKQQNTSALT